MADRPRPRSVAGATRSRWTARTLAALVLVGGLLGATGSAGAAPAAPSGGELPAPVPVPVLPPIEDPDAPSSRLVPVPVGCAAPAVEQSVFIGSLLIADAVTARFRVDQVLSGSVEGFSVDGMIDVRYGDEVRFLEVGVSYIVGAAVDPELGVLASTVRAPAPLFGGTEIAGIDDADVDCPQIDSPVRTVLLDGSSVETGVFTPLRDAERQILRSVLVPIGVAFAVLSGLVVLKHLLFALGRSLRDLSVSGKPSLIVRRRRHGAATSKLERF
ncbi:MAG: hypothetical protein ACK5CE_19235 [Actinomycetes bacterium]